MPALLQMLANCRPQKRTEISQQLNLSPEQIANEIAELRQQGLNIEESELFVCLIPQTPLLKIFPISTALSEQIPNVQVHYQPVISSTNEYILHNIAHLNKGDVCLTEYQHAGRGRRGRQWLSPFAGQLMFSLYWTLPQQMSLDGLSCVIGVAIAEALQNYGVKVKWPNDLLLAQRKLGGILVELANHKNGLHNLVIGVGINVSLPKMENISQPYAQLSECDFALDRGQILIQIIKRIYQRLSQFERCGIDAEFQQKWLELDAFLNDEVKVITEKQEISGLEQGIDERGYLKLITEQGQLYFNGGEVSLRKK